MGRGGTTLVERDRAMALERKFLVLIAMAVAAASSAFAQTPSIPDLSGVWDHPVFPWFEPPASGPGPITNLSRWEQYASDGSAPLPPGKIGVSNYNQLVGDYKNPILQPWA